jgi:type II secretory pathway pseudopilin PulG
MALAGLILGYFGVALIPFLIIAAIAIPNLLRARIAANQASAVGSLRTLNTAAITYATTYNKGYPASITALGPPLGTAVPDADAAGLIDERLASGTKSGYVFTYSPGEKDDHGRVGTYTIRADPLTPGTTGQNHYFTDQTGVIRQETDRPANEQSPPIGI